MDRFDEKFDYQDSKVKMKKDSALQILSSYRLQYRDANCIFLILSAIVMLIDLYLLITSDSLLIVLLMSFTILLCLSAIFSYQKFLPLLLKSNSNVKFYIGSAIEYACIMIGVAPICVYLYVEQQWGVFNKYGAKCFFLFNYFENWLLPISIFMMASYTYWLIIYYVKKESTLFYHLEKKKKELYE